MSELYIKKLFPFIFLFSAVIGAYSTTAEYRIRYNLPLITKGCSCPSCGHPLSILHQIPVISWLFLRGKCHYCRKPIPVRYPLIEACFIFYYGGTFLLFPNRPITYIISWFLFVTLFLMLRANGRWKNLLKGLGVMYLYHILFALVLLVIYEALKIS